MRSVVEFIWECLLSIEKKGVVQICEHVIWAVCCTCSGQERHWSKYFCTPYLFRTPYINTKYGGSSLHVHAPYGPTN
jgi:hypothetical protein